MKHVIYQEEAVIAKIQAIMTKLKTLLLAAKMLELNSISAKTLKVTRWSSTGDMILRYERIKDEPPKLNLREIDALSLSTPEKMTVEALLMRLKDLKSVTMTLQRD